MPRSSDRPEPAALELTERAWALWQQLAAAYDDVARGLDSGAWADLDGVATQIASVERLLQPLVTRLAALRAADPCPLPMLAERWRALDDFIEQLARRLVTLERSAVEARNATAARLARTRVARSRAAGYRPGNASAPCLTSRRV